jgi:hypothetical protein
MQACQTIEMEIARPVQKVRYDETASPTSPGHSTRPLIALAICLSLANLQFVAGWHAIQDSYSTEAQYFTLDERVHTFELTLIAAVFALTALLFAADRYFRIPRSALLTWAYRSSFLALFSLAVIRIVKAPDASRLIFQFFGPGGLWVVPRIVALILAVIALTARPAIFTRVRSLLLLLSPLLLVQIATIAWMHFTQPAPNLSARKMMAPKLHENTRGRRLVWIVFDEMDQHIAFDKRPAGLVLPELDRLRQQSFYATSALPPSQFTRDSIPSLLTGRIVQRTVPVAANDVNLVWKDDSASMRLSQQATILSAARSLGMNAAAVGHYLPYCRIFPDYLTTCESFAAPLYNQPSLWRNYVNHMPLQAAFAEHLLKTIRVSASPANFAGERAFVANQLARIVQGQLLEAKSILADPSLDFVFLHLYTPHPPGIYDVSAGSVAPDTAGGYIDNFVLVDRILGEVRRQLEAAGSWDESTILISSDHSLRHSIWLIDESPELSPDEKKLLKGQTGKAVPFVLKLPFQNRSVEYRQTFNTVVSPYLLIAVMKGEVTSAEQAARFLDGKARELGQSSLHSFAAASHANRIP